MALATHAGSSPCGPASGGRGGCSRLSGISESPGSCGAPTFGWRRLVRRTGLKTRLRPLEGALEYAAGETADLVSQFSLGFLPTGDCRVASNRSRAWTDFFDGHPYGSHVRPVWVADATQGSRRLLPIATWETGHGRGERLGQHTATRWLGTRAGWPDQAT